jgi:hypothetical protein
VPASQASLESRKFLLALVADLTQDENYLPCFKAAHREMHLFFWQLNQNPEYRPFVEDLLFDTNGNFPHCEQIDELLQEFQLSGILSRPNPTYRFNDITITSSPSGDEFKRNLSREQEETYKEILELFKRDLGVRKRK